MKICPDCALANEECFPVCVVCNASLADIRSTPAADPAHPEHERRVLDGERRRVARRQVAWAAGGYVLVIGGSAVWPGGVTDPEVGLLYVVSALVVALAAEMDLVGGFAAGALQGAMSVTLVLCFGPGGLTVAFLLAGHALAPMMFCQWIEMIHDAHR